MAAPLGRAGLGGAGLGWTGPDLVKWEGLEAALHAPAVGPGVDG